MTNRVLLVLGCLWMTGCGGGDDGGNAPEPNSQWRIEVRSASVPTTNPVSGETWDAGGGAPDPFVCIQVTSSGDAFCSTPTADTFDPVWNYTFPGSYSHAELESEFAMVMFDEDVSEPDQMLIYEGNLQASTAGESRDIPLTGDGFTLTFRVKP